MRLRAVLSLLLFSLPLRAQPPPAVLDTFDDIAGWRGVTSHGDASKVSLHSAAGRFGNAMLIVYSFLGHMGSVAAEKKFNIPLPADYQISFDIRGEGPANNFVIRFMDSLENVWWVNRSNFVFPSAWTKMTIRKSQIQYGWGPSGGGELRTLDRIMLMIDVVEGGKGRIWIDNLAIEQLGGGKRIPLRISASSAAKGFAPAPDSGGSALAGWRSARGRTNEWLALDCGYVRDIGGLAITWEENRSASSFDVLLSDDGKTWRCAYASERSSPLRNYVYTGDAAARFVRIDMNRAPGQGAIGIRRLELKGPEFGFSYNEFFRALASDAPRGFYPAYLYGEQSYWTIVGAPGDSRKALINEQGMIETDKLSCSLEPFLYTGGRLLTWNDCTLTQTLDREYLPIPSVRRDMSDSLRLTMTALSSGDPGASSLLIRYVLENRSLRRRNGHLFVAVRPFQVNPPWQTFTIVGGAARIDSILYDGVVRAGGVTIVPVTPPAGFGAAGFDEGPVTDYLASGKLPPRQSVRDHFGFPSAALRYDFDIPAGGSNSIVIDAPFHGSRSPLPALGGAAAAGWFEAKRAETASSWERLLGGVAITLPGEARSVVNAVRSSLAYILMTADGPALQPGARSYQRSWVRDGSLTSEALLEMGIAPPVRRYVDWYARFQYPDGKIPAIVESRGPDPTPENDSHGEFLYMIREYFSFSRDTTWLAGKWENVRNTVGAIRSLRNERKTDVYRNGTPLQRACFGLVPESISHEGYCPAPMHSYWDDFFILRGLKDASYIARVLGKSEAVAFAAERDDCAADLLASLRQAIRNRNIRFIPGCAELGDFSGLSTTVAVTPCDVLESLPPRETRYTFDESYRMFLDRKNGIDPWESYLPYEARFIGAYVLLDEKERASALLDFLMDGRRPAAWNEWAEVVWKDRRAGKNIGDMPHSWAASDFIRSFRTMIACERERDSCLLICAGIPDAWVRNPPGIEVRNLPTHFGPLSYRIRPSAGGVVVEIGAGTDIPPGGIRVRSPLSAGVREIRGAATAKDDPRDALVESLPARVVFTY